MTNVDLLRQTLIGIQAHAAGLHANAGMALQILTAMQTEKPEIKPEYRSQREQKGPIHYGEPDPAEMDKIFNGLENTGATAPAAPE